MQQVMNKQAKTFLMSSLKPFDLCDLNLYTKSVQLGFFQVTSNFVHLDKSKN